jgi:DhnA family fructose-bisphosphate aldolase class Ia
LEIVKGAGEGCVWDVSIGSNVFQQEGPTKMLEAICALVHLGAKIRKELEFLQ